MDKTHHGDHRDPTPKTLPLEPYARPSKKGDSSKKKPYQYPPPPGSKEQEKQKDLYLQTLPPTLYKPPADSHSKHDAKFWAEEEKRFEDLQKLITEEYGKSSWIQKFVPILDSCP